LLLLIGGDNGNIRNEEETLSQEDGDAYLRMKKDK
jgi:hypothetical protein